MAFIIMASLSALVLAACGSEGLVIPTKVVDPTPTTRPADRGPDEIWSTTPGPGGGYTTVMPCAALYREVRIAELKGGDVEATLLRRIREASGDWEKPLSDIERALNNCYKYSPPTPPPGP